MKALGDNGKNAPDNYPMADMIAILAYTSYDF
jgi:hypothetical protein